MKIVRATVQYTALPQHVVVEGMPTQVRSKVLGVFGANALIDTETDAVLFPRQSGTGVLGYLEQLGVTVNRNQMLTAEEHRGVMVCLYPAKEIAEKFAVEGGEPVENMHVTLAYLGKKDELPEDALDRAVEACTDAVSNQEVLSGEIGGIGRWAAGDEDCVYASVDLPGSNELRERLCGELQTAGVPARANHGWSAHMTIQYLEPGLDVKINHVDPVKVSFGSIWVVSGDNDRQEIKFGSKESTTVERQPTEAFNVTQRRRLARNRSNNEMETILRNGQDKHVSPENVKKVVDRTGLDVTKTADQQKLREKLGLSGEPGVTAAFERQIQNKLGWW